MGMGFNVCVVCAKNIANQRMGLDFPNIFQRNQQVRVDLAIALRVPPKLVVG